MPWPRCSPAKFTSNVTGYRNAVSVPLPFSIGQANANIAISGVSVPADGNSHPASGSASGVEGPTPAPLGNLLHLFSSSDGGNSVSSNAPVNPGRYEVYYTFDGNTDYYPVSSKTDSHQAVVLTSASQLPGVQVDDNGNSTSAFPKQHSMVRSLTLTFNQSITAQLSQVTTSLTLTRTDGLVINLKPLRGTLALCQPISPWQSGTIGCDVTLHKPVVVPSGRVGRLSRRLPDRFAAFASPKKSVTCLPAAGILGAIPWSWTFLA
jgi:hypothetical protein